MRDALFVAQGAIEHVCLAVCIIAFSICSSRGVKVIVVNAAIVDFSGTHCYAGRGVAERAR